MALIYRGQFLNRMGFNVAIGCGLQSGFPSDSNFVDRGIQLSTIEGIPVKASDPNKWMIPWTSLPEETPVWVSRFPDMLPQPEMPPTQGVVTAPLQPLPGRSVFPDFLVQPEILQAQGAVVPPQQPSRGWYPVFPDQVDALKATPDLYQFIAQPIVVNVYTGDRAVPIHVPDEAPIGEVVTINVEHDVGGVAVPFDVPPLLRVYHLTAAGVQVVDLPYGVCTQYGANPSYFRNWTPVAKGIYMVEVVGIFTAQVVVGVVPLTIRAKFDPFALSNQDVMVQRNGDVP